MSKRPQLFGKTLFVDLMMSTLVVVTALLIASNAVEKEKQQKAIEEASIRTDGEYAITMVWPDGSMDDVDLYVRDPAGKIAFFSARDVGLMHLEHDDQGASSDQEKTGSGNVQVDRNEERVILRGTIPGEYTVNAHMYGKRDPQPTTVTIRLFKLKGDDTQVAMRSVTLARDGAEMTAFRFIVNADGSLAEINQLQRSLVGAGAGAGQPRLRFPGGP